MSKKYKASQYSERSPFEYHKPQGGNMDREENRVPPLNGNFKNDF